MKTNIAAFLFFILSLTGCKSRHDLAEETARRKLEALDVRLEGSPVREVYLNERIGIDKTFLTLLKEFKSLEVLDCSHTDLDDEACATFPDMPSLIDLTLYSCRRLTDKGLIHVGKIKTLKRLDLTSTQVTSFGLLSLKPLAKQLTQICLIGTEIDDSAMEVLSTFTKMEELYLWKTRISAQGLQKLKGLQDLRKLLAPPGTTNATMTLIAQLKKLEVLDLSDTQISDFGLSEIQGLKLLSLGLGSTKVSARGLRSIDGERLATLNLRNTPINDDVFKTIERFKRLKGLTLSGTSVTNNGLKTLDNPELRELDLYDLKVSDETIKEIQRRHPLLRINY